MSSEDQAIVAVAIIVLVLIGIAILACCGPAEQKELVSHGAWYGELREQGAFVL